MKRGTMCGFMNIKTLLKTFMRSSDASNERDREQWLMRVLQSIPKGSRILDAGAGTQRYRKFCENLHYVSQDFGQYNGQGDGVGLQSEGFSYGVLDIVSDIVGIPEPDNSFDAIMCIEVLEHLKDPVLALKEFSRLLKPGGHLILTAPFCSLTHFAPYHFSTGFNRYWYQHHLENNGLDVVEITANGGYFDYLAQEMCRVTEVARRYTGCKPRLRDLAGLFFMHRMLARFRRRDMQSSELLCFGYHVLARRR